MIATPGNRAAPKTLSVQSLERSMQILELLARSRNGLTLSQVIRSLKLPKSSVHCILLTFVRCGYLHRDERTGRYKAGMRLFRLANTALAGMNPWGQIAPLLHELARNLGMAIHFGILEQDEAILLEKAEPPGFPPMATFPGKRMGLHCTAIGKALAAFQPERELERLVRKHGLIKYNENTIDTFAKLKEHLVQVRAIGYAVDDEEEEIGVRCVGVPVLHSDGSATAAISASGTLDQLRTERIDSLVSHLKRVAAAIAERHASMAPGDAD